MFTNKHVIMAMLVAPILALIAYFSVDALVSETPHAAQAGQQYKLIAKPNCRYSSGVCGLKNGDFELTITGKWQDKEHLNLTVTSKHPLEGVIAAHIHEGEENPAPVNLQSTDTSGLTWSLQLFNPNAQMDQLHLAASAKKTLYFGEAALAFIEYETAFQDDFRQ